MAVTASFSGNALGNSAALRIRTRFGIDLHAAATNKLRASLRALRVFAVNSDSPLPLFPDELEDDFPIARPVVEVDKNQLLPCAQQQFTAFERDGQARLHQGGTDVAIAVHIPPPLVMLVVDSSGRDTFDRGAEVVNRAGFKFDRRY